MRLLPLAFARDRYRYGAWHWFDTLALEYNPVMYYSQLKQYGRDKCRTTVLGLTEEKAHQPCKFTWGELSFMELQRYNMCHLQEHASQLYLLLGQNTGSAPGWVTGGQRRRSDG